MATQNPSVLQPEYLTPADLRHLATVQSEQFTTITMETHAAGKETRQDTIRFKNLVRRAEELGMPQNIAKQLTRLEHDDQFWRFQAQGLAIVVDGQHLHLLQLRRSLPESAYVGPVPMIRSLAPAHAMPAESLVLTLSWEGAQLYRIANEKLEELSDGAFPVTFSQLIAPRDPEAQLQYRSHASSGDGSGQQVAVYHGQGDGEGKIEGDRTNYLARLGDLVAREIYNRDVCLVMVGTEEVLGEFESVCDVEPTLRVHMSPDGLDRSGLAERVRAGMRDYLSQLQSELSQQCSDADSAGHLTTDPSQIVAAALQGRVKCLLYRDDAKLLGSVDAETMGMQPADGEDAMDLVNLAAVHTLRNGGEIYRIDADDLLVESMVAILRY